MRYLKIWGLKRSGTNFMRYVLEGNFRDVRALADVCGWKHGTISEVPESRWRHWYPEQSRPVKPIEDDLLAEILDAYLGGLVDHVMVVRNPYDWLVSSLRWRRGPGLERASDSLIASRVNRWVSWVAEALAFRERMLTRSECAGLWHLEALDLDHVRRCYALEWKPGRNEAPDLPSRPLLPTGDLREGHGMMRRDGPRFDHSRAARDRAAYSPAKLALVNGELRKSSTVIEAIGYEIKEESLQCET